jgi:hypothetical protein
MVQPLKPAIERELTNASELACLLDPEKASSPVCFSGKSHLSVFIAKQV